MENRIEPTLQVRHQSDADGHTGVVPGQTYQNLLGVPAGTTDRLRLGRATYRPRTLEPLHWHPIEALYYVISGAATVRDIAGNEFPVHGGSYIYAPAGLAGAHEWEVADSLELLDIRATYETSRKFQFTVDKDTLRSYIDINELLRREGVSFRSHY